MSELVTDAPEKSPPTPPQVAEPTAEPQRDANLVPRRRRWLGLFPRRPGPLGLRRRILLIFTLGALGLAAFLAFTTYGLVRSNLASQRDRSSIAEADRNSRLVNGTLQRENVTLALVTNTLESTGTGPFVLRWNG